MALRLVVLLEAVRGRLKAAAAGAAEAAVRRRSPPVPCRELLTTIPTLAVFGTSRTRRRRASKGLTHRPVADVALAAAEPLAQLVPAAAVQVVAVLPLRLPTS